MFNRSHPRFYTVTVPLAGQPHRKQHCFQTGRHRSVTRLTRLARQAFRRTAAVGALWGWIRSAW